MKWLIAIKQDLTACHTMAKGKLNRTLSEELFDNEDDALKAQEKHKNSFKFFGLAGQYVTWPRQVDDNYKLFTKFCDHCDQGIDSDAYDDLPNGSFCSRTCFRNSYQEQSSYDDEPYYEDEY